MGSVGVVWAKVVSGYTKLRRKRSDVTRMSFWLAASPLGLAANQKEHI